MLFKNQLLTWVISLLSTCFFLFPNSVLAGQADLRVLRITTSPHTPAANDEVMFEIIVKNVGAASPKKASLHVGIWSVNENGARINGTNIPMLFSSYSKNIPKLGSNEIIILSKSRKIQYAGKHRIEASINTEGFLAGEELSGNNFSQKYFRVQPVPALPDLVVCFKKNNKVPPHRKSTFPVRIRNIGNAASAPCDLRFWIEKKGVKHYIIPALAPGETRYIQRSVYWASRRTSKFSLKIDSKKQVDEKYENNNIIQGTICTQKYCISPANSPIKCSNVSN